MLHEAIVGLSQELTNGHEMEPADWYTVPVPHIAYDEILQQLEEANLAHDPSFNREHSWSHRRDGLPRDKQTKLPTLRQDEFESQLDGNRSSFRTGNAVSAGVGEASRRRSSAWRTRSRRRRWSWRCRRSAKAGRRSRRR